MPTSIGNTTQIRKIREVYLIPSKVSKYNEQLVLQVFFEFVVLSIHHWYYNSNIEIEKYNLRRNGNFCYMGNFSHALSQVTVEKLFQRDGLFLVEW